MMQHLYQVIQQSIETVQEHILQLLDDHKREKNSLRTLVVSKTHSFEHIVIAQKCGMHLFGENRIQEFIKKKQTYTPLSVAESLDTILSDINVHFIGSLQSNKVGKVLEHFSCIQSVDSIDLLEKICNQVHMKTQNIQNQEEQLYDTAYPIFLQIRCSQYDYKRGFDSMDMLFRAIELCMHHQTAVRLEGLMCIAPFSDDENIVRKSFALTRDWAEKAWNHFVITTQPQLSMGMSNDYPLAIAEGSTMLRLGSLIFGNRT